MTMCNSRQRAFLYSLFAMFIAATTAHAEMGHIPMLSPYDPDKATIDLAVPTLVANPAQTQPTIDGQIQDNAWQNSPWSEGFRVASTHHATQYPTRIKAAYDDQYLYLAMQCAEPAPDTLVATTSDKDKLERSWLFIEGRIWPEDMVELLIDETATGAHFYQFIVNPNNARDAVRYDHIVRQRMWYTTQGAMRINEGVSVAAGPRPTQWQSATKVGEKAWTVELAIPLKEINLSINPGQTVARINFTRNRMADNPEYSLWCDGNVDVENPSRFGYIAFANEKGTYASTPQTIKVAGLDIPRPADVFRKHVDIQIHPDSPTTPLQRFWDGKNYSRSREEMAQSFDPGFFTHVRCESSGFSASVVDGQVVVDFARADSMFDNLRNLNISEPLINLRGGPRRGIEYRTIRDPQFGRVSGPPVNKEDYKLIYEAYRQYFQHILDRYGREYFDSLRFEVMNEPDATMRFYCGTNADYCEFYDWVSKAARDVSPTAKVGGPATAGGAFDYVRRFLQHCKNGTNAATGQVGAPLDFVTFHVYGWRSSLTTSGAQRAMNMVIEVWDILKDQGADGVEFYLSEWGVEAPDFGGDYFWFRKSQYAPVWTAQFMTSIDDARQNYAALNPDMTAVILCNYMDQRTVFPGFRFLFTSPYMVPKPYFNGFILMNELGDQRLKVTETNQTRVHCLATRRDDGATALLVYHFKEYQRDIQPQENIDVTISGLDLAGKNVIEMRIDEYTANSYTAWLDMGSPEQLTEEQANLLKDAARVEKVTLQPENSTIRTVLPVNSVVMILIENQ